MSADFRYKVTVRPGVSIGPREYTDVVNLTSPQPEVAVARALRRIARRDPENQLWQSNRVEIVVERTS